MGKGARQRYRRNLKISVVVGIILSGLMWWIASLIWKP